MGGKLENLWKKNNNNKKTLLEGRERERDSWIAHTRVDNKTQSQGQSLCSTTPHHSSQNKKSDKKETKNPIQ